MAKTTHKQNTRKKNGNIKTSDLMKLVATVANDVTIQNYGNVMKPQDATLMKKGGGKGLRLYEEVERDGRVKSLLEKRKAKVKSREWVVMPDDDDNSQAQEAAKLVELALRKLPLSRINGNLLDATNMGVAFCEVVWHIRDNLILPQTIKKRRAARFVFDTDWKPRLLTPDNPSEGIELPARKIIVHRHDDDGSDPYGTGLGRVLFWNVLFKREGVQFWGRFLEKFASPTPFGRYPIGTPPAEIDRTVDLLRNLTQSGVLVMPLGSEIDFLESANAETMSFENWNRYWDEDSAITILGETLSTSLDGSGSRAAAETHVEVSDGIADDDADILSETYNETIVRWLIDLNMPGAPYPTIWFPRTKNEAAIEALKTKRAERRKAEMELLEQARKNGYIPADGMKASYSEIFETEMISLPARHDNQEIKNFAAPLEHDEIHDISELIDDLDDTMQPVFSGWIETIKKEMKKSIDQGESLADFAEQILALYPELTLTPFADTLSSALAAAEAKGQSDVLEDD